MAGIETRAAFQAEEITAPSTSISSATWRTNAPIALFATCLAAQLYLLFYKSFNWDEFLHFSQVYQARAGTLAQSLQVLHARILWWAPDVATNLIDQMRAARAFVWCMHLVTLGMIYGLARQFTNRANAFFAAFAYLTAGYVLSHAFAIRPDTLVTATLMGALFLLVSGRLTLLKAIAAGTLLGLAGMMTIKAAFYAPCFAGVAWLKGSEASRKREFVGKLAIVCIAAVTVFAAIYLYQSAHIAEAPVTLRKTSSSSNLLRWLTPSMPFAIYSAREIIRAPLFFFGLALAPLAWSRAGLKVTQKLALTSFIAPLVALFFYRNTFPYFFVFILAPAAVAIAPALGLMRERVGGALLAIALAAIPLTMAVLEPRDMIGRQRALIDYVHREFPNMTSYLDYCGMIADYPRILRYLTSGNGIQWYHDQGDPIVAREVNRGRVPFIIANQPVIAEALEGRPIPDTFLPDDLSAMKGDYVQQWGVLWREGVQIPAGGTFALDLRRGGDFTLAAGNMTIDGRNLTQGETIRLQRGRHLIGGKRSAPSTLWRGDKLPTSPPNVPMDRVFTNF